MKCQYCNQEMIDIKDYCVSCGKKLTKDNTVNSKSIFIVFALLIVVGVFVCYMIVNYNVDKEIEPYIDKSVIKSTK